MNEWPFRVEFFQVLEVPWMSAVWFSMVDVCLIIYMRDSVLLFFNVFLKNKSIIDWQAEGVKIAKDRQKKNMSLICPPSAFLKAEIQNESEQQIPLQSIP